MNDLFGSRPSTAKRIFQIRFFAQDADTSFIYALCIVHCALCITHSLLIQQRIRILGRIIQ